MNKRTAGKMLRKADESPFRQGCWLFTGPTICCCGGFMVVHVVRTALQIPELGFLSTQWDDQYPGERLYLNQSTWGETRRLIYQQITDSVMINMFTLCRDKNTRNLLIKNVIMKQGNRPTKGVPRPAWGMLKNPNQIARDPFSISSNVWFSGFKVPLPWTGKPIFDTFFLSFFPLSSFLFFLPFPFSLFYFTHSIFRSLEKSPIKLAIHILMEYIVFQHVLLKSAIFQSPKAS